MNITLDNQYATSASGNREAITTTYNTATHTTDKTVIAMGGSTSDIADKVMDNEAYKGHGLTADDIMQQAANTDVDTQRDFMIVMSHCVSGEDYEKLAEDGFNPADVDVESLVTIVDRIKATLAQAGVDVEGYTDTLDEETLEQITGAVTQALEIKNMPDDMVKYLIENAKAPTIENLYKAGFSTADNMVQARGYYSDGGYYAKKADEIDWDNLKGSIDTVISKAGLESSNEVWDGAKWLVESGIELNTDNLNRLMELRSMEFPMDENDISEACIKAVMNGKSPYEANLCDEKLVDEEVSEIADEVENITDAGIRETINSGMEINIKNLYNKSIEALDEVGNDTEASLKEIQARRELEEIRLMMSEEANRHLIKSGVSIDTTKLSELVEMLKDAEQQIKNTLFNGADDEENNRLSSLYEETLTKTGELKEMPAAILGIIAPEIGKYSLENIHQEGTALYENGNYRSDEYEKLMTQPRRDLGDSITKAFRNVDDILTDMGLETSDTNRRAVRILGYNSMDITKENIDTIKQADQKVNDVITRMTPATTLKMIREGKNPLEMDMDELDEYLGSRDGEKADDAVKYSRFLQKLDRENAITQDEREAYIGIYRLFNQIEKSDGAVIGSIVATGAEMNFKNMLSAVRTSKNKGMDISIDDGFGALEKLITGSKAIDVQINEGFSQNAENGADSDSKEQEKYYAALSGNIKDELSDKTDVSKLKDVGLSGDTTIEMFNDSLKDIESDETFQANAFEEYRESLNEAARADDQIIKLLIGFDQPVSLDNINAAKLMMNDKNSLFGKFAGKDDDNDSSVLNASDEFIDNLENEESAQNSYKDVIMAAQEKLEDMVYSPESTYIDVKAARSMYKALSLAGNLSDEENYQVPMDIKGEITTVNLKIYHNNTDKGKVSVTLENEKLGKVAAEFDVMDDRTSGMIVYENRASKPDLEQLNNNLREEFGDRQLNISLVQSDFVDLERFGNDREKSGTVTTNELYRTAKAFMTALKGI
jgi:hypothetical protein